MQEFDLSGRDLRLLHALQVRPRAPWATLAPVVGADAVTLARRWNVLQETGLAWIAAYQGQGAKYATAIMEIECTPASIRGVIEELASGEEVASIDQTAGGRDLMVTLFCRTEAELANFVVDKLPLVPGITRSRTHRVTGLLTDAQRWRLRSLQEKETRQLEAQVPQPTAARGVSAEMEAGVSVVLRANPRAPLTEISGMLGVNAARAKSALASILAEKRLVLRLELARPYTPWPVAVWYFLRVPATKVEAVGGKLVGLEEVRLVVTTGGLYSILMVVWLRRVEDMTLLERQLGERLPFADIVDRCIVLRTPKHMGKMLRPDGRRIV
ncbi:Lrp/AsnC family transcriptional regulator [Paenarthrobacter sp. NPDC089316]|uniref:Lrp/AsnC family transcriptional regulator n=1 Tax=unclassified Paenarthrobacter TaxID=2634190 RepID=UPI003425DD52